MSAHTIVLVGGPHDGHVGEVTFGLAQGLEFPNMLPPNQTGLGAGCTLTYRRESGVRDQEGRLVFRYVEPG